ncbi:SusC/RagA family TonB-linked outer membrane protein [Coprobacter tertius]|uniref:TonB-dependent receptor n=1 Tax=Coprobacter tertius TaxID=2944915 RepID=A0ABT1MFT8_9BACT|nr:TonB-dependent receptor [Coprobacter tertius]MCP9611507.1 TonB-dependent receptor [Coprobacter tertius]
MKQIHLKLHSIKLFAVFMMLFASISFVEAAQKLTGRVTDTKGELMIGVTVTEKGTNNAVITDVNGTYNIVLQGANPVISVTYIGFKPQEIKIKPNQTLLDIVLEENVTAMNEVVVVGYGEQRKIAAVGSQSQLKVGDMKMPAANLSSSLAGRLSGVVSVQRTGEPGHDDSDIWIRGISTFTNQNSKPLILVDGVERDFSQIDVNDIESFTVLKDASATAVYGVRGANGVILIQTKPGKVGKPQFSLDYYEGFTQLTYVPDMADGFQYMDAANEASQNSGGPVLFKPGYIEATKKAYGLIPNDNPHLYNKYLYPNVDWIDELYKDWGHNRRLNMSVRGGVPNATYYVSLSYYDESGLTNKGDIESYDVTMKYRRYNFVSNVDLKATDKTLINVGVQGYFANGHYPAEGSGNIFAQAMDVSPVAYAKEYPDGSVPGTQSNGDYRNPWSDLTRRGYKEEYTTKVNMNIKLTQDLDFWNWSKGLKVYALAAFDVTSGHTASYTKRESTFFINSSKDENGLWVNPYNEDGTLNLVRTYESGNPTLGYGNGQNGNRTFYFEAALNYDRVFARKHRVGAMFLFNTKELRYTDVGDLIASVPYKNQGIAARATYSYDDRYFLELNMGYNGSENFAPSNRFGFFPAVGVGWVPSNERFWDPIRPYVSFLKFRYTDGKVGSDVIGSRRFGYMTLMTDGNAGYRWGSTSKSGVAISDYGVNVKWSTSRKRDFGVDLKFLNDNLSFVFDYFHERREGIFLQRISVPDYIGLNNLPMGNLGIVENHGYELSMDYTQPITKDITLTVRGNFTWNEDKIIENDDAPPAYPWLDRKGSNVLARWGYVAEGLFTSMEEIEASPLQFGETAGEPRKLSPGDIKYKDMNGDGVIDEYDQVKIGRGDVPKMYYGFGGDLRIGNLSLSVLFQGVAKADRNLSGSSIMPFQGDGGKGNLYANIGDRWSEDDPTNQNVFYPRLGYGSSDFSNQNNFKTSTWWKRDVSFLRLKQVNISYYFPKKWFDGTRVSGARVYVMGTNLLTWSKFDLWDPELNTNNGVSYPNVRTYSVGLSFNF